MVTDVEQRQMWVEQEDSVYPIVPTGAALHQMVERPSSVAETAAD